LPVAILKSASSVTNFIDLIKGIKRTPGGVLVFRGQQNGRWNPHPGILRPPGKLLARERDAVRDLLAVHPQEFAADATMFDRLVRMQHYGLPTRLLDVTGNPLVALYFATARAQERNVLVEGKVFAYEVPASRQKYFDSDAVSCVANLSNLGADEKEQIRSSILGMATDKFNNLPAVDRLIQFVRAEKPHFRPRLDREDLFKPYYVKPKMSNRRIVAQNGSFIIYGIDRDKMLTGKDPIKTNIISIPADLKLSIRNDLDSIGINESTLFPEIDRAASYIARNYSS